jgi:hypothetical protein
VGIAIPQHTAILVCILMAHPTISQYISNLHQLLLDNLGLTGLFVELATCKGDINIVRFLITIGIGSTMGIAGGILLVCTIQQFRHFVVGFVDNLLLILLTTSISGVCSAFYYFYLTLRWYARSNDVLEIADRRRAVCEFKLF